MIDEALLPKPSRAVILFMFLKSFLFNSVMILVDSFIVWLAWTFVLVPKFGVVSLGVFHVVAIVIGLSSLYRGIRGV